MAHALPACGALDPATVQNPDQDSDNNIIDNKLEQRPLLIQMIGARGGTF